MKAESVARMQFPIKSLCLFALTVVFFSFSITNLRAQSCTNNRIANPGFENLFSGWAVTSGVSITSIASNGIRAALISGSNDAISQNLNNITPGVTYTLSANVRFFGTPPSQMYFKVVWKNASLGVISENVMNGPFASSLTYAPYSLTATAPAGAVAATIIAAKVGTGNFRIDNFCLSANCSYTISSTASNDSPKCIGQNINLSSGPNGMVSYVWSGPSGFAATTQNPTIQQATSAEAGVYTVTMTDFNGCTSTRTTTVTVNGQGTAGCNCLLQGCSSYVNLVFNGTVTQTANPAGLVGDTWRINGVATGVDAQMKIVRIKNATGVQNIDNNGAGVVVPNNWSPELNFNLVANDSSYVDWEISLFVAGTTTPATLAQGSRVTSIDVDGNNTFREFHRHLNTNGYVANNPTELTFPSVPPYTIVGGSNTEHTGISDDPEVKATFYYPQTTTVYQVRLGVIASASASGTVNGRQYAISYNPCQSYSNPVVNPVFPVVAGPSIVCLTAPVQTYTLNNSFPAMSWTITGGTIISGQGTQTVTVDWTATGSKSLTATTTDANGCSFSDQKFVSVVNDLILNITDSLSVCLGAVAPLGTYVQGGSGSYTYQWQRSTTGTSGWTNISGATAATYNAPTTVAGTIWYQLIVVDVATNCGTATSPVAPVLVRPDLTVTTTNSAPNVCVGGSSLLTAIVSNGAGSFVYQWQSSPTSGGTYSNIAGAIFSTYSPPTSAVGTIFYRVIVNAEYFGCDPGTSAFTSVTVSSLTPSASNNGPICANATLQLQALPAGMTYSWSGPDGFVSTLQNPAITFAQPVNAGVYTVTVTNASGCSATANTTATINATVAKPGPIGY
jgi:hypothetical protein